MPPGMVRSKIWVAGLNPPKLIDRGEIDVAGDKDIDQFALVLVQRRRDVDGLLNGDAGGGVGGARGVVDLD